jgi:hypothetical protein
MLSPLGTRRCVRHYCRLGARLKACFLGKPVHWMSSTSPIHIADAAGFAAVQMSSEALQ